ncbi:MAG: hypothetical protein M3P34_03505 [Actinomycetota bacterium]|nr:hypothetical protein [Actinomycetota bacterium]
MGGGSLSSWSLVRFTHVLAATGWVGGQLVLSGVVVPAVRATVNAPADRVALLRDTGRRFASIAHVVLLPTLVATGLALVWHRQVAAADLGSTTCGRLLTAKLLLLAASVGLAAAHGIIARRRAGASRGLAIAGLAASVGIVAFGTALVP